MDAEELARGVQPGGGCDVKSGGRNSSDQGLDQALRASQQSKTSSPDATAAGRARGATSLFA